jgi:hypothetical protein
VRGGKVAPIFMVVVAAAGLATLLGMRLPGRWQPVPL